MKFGVHIAWDRVRMGAGPLDNAISQAVERRVFCRWMLEVEQKPSVGLDLGLSRRVKEPRIEERPADERNESLVVAAPVDVSVALGLVAQLLNRTNEFALNSLGLAS